MPSLRAKHSLGKIAEVRWCQVLVEIYLSSADGGICVTLLQFGAQDIHHGMTGDILPHHLSPTQISNNWLLYGYNTLFLVVLLLHALILSSAKETGNK